MSNDRTGAIPLHSECYACPVGTFFEGVQQAGAPDTVDRLLSVAHELLDIARGAIDAADAAVEEQRTARSARSDRATRVRRIDIA